jgi:hypothetical protein
MDKISELKKIISENFAWNKARLDCFVRMLLALFAVRTVNLSEIAVGFASKAEVNSRYKRIQRFFVYFKMDYTSIAKWIFKLFFLDNKEVYITIDRTNWYWGKSKINIFMLGIAYEGIAIPLFWSLLPKAGSSNFKEQKALLERFVETFNCVKIIGLLADREFASGKLFRWLNRKKIPFYIRIKEGTRIYIRDKKFLIAKKLFNDLQVKTSKVFHMTVWIFGEKVYLAGSRSERGELMIVTTNQKPKNAIEIYLRRWEIESLFQTLKGRGFRFEETHMTTLDRIEKLIVLLAVGFCWAHKVGEWKAIAKKPIILKKHRDSSRPQNSFFRYGFDLIRDNIINPFNKIVNFRECLRVFTKPLSIQEAIS